MNPILEDRKLTSAILIDGLTDVIEESEDLYSKHDIVDFLRQMANYAREYKRG